MQGKRITLGVTGGIAAYKSAELTRLLIKMGAQVRVVMTRAATQFVTPLTFQALSGQPVVIDEQEAETGNGMAHIALGRECDILLIAPATANFIARLAQGNADDVLSATCLARDCALWVVPAMNQHMWQHPATQRNVAQIQADGAHILMPSSGEQACGEVGVGRMQEPEAIVQALRAFFMPSNLSGVRVLITAGPTIERLDPIRALTNFSSGKMGYAVAQAAHEAGAQVTLISGPTCLVPPAQLIPIAVESAQDMQKAVDTHIASADIFISVAAVADYRPSLTHTSKIKKTQQSLSIELLANPDILATAAARPNAPYCVGFAAETEQLLQHGEAKRQQKKLPMLVVNDAKIALNNDNNALIILDDQGAHHLPFSDKLSLARQFIAHLAHAYTDYLTQKVKP